MLLGEVSPMHHLRDSTTFDLPHPFGPTIPVNPFSMIISVGSTNDLNPSIESGDTDNDGVADDCDVCPFDFYNDFV